MKELLAGRMGQNFEPQIHSFASVSTGEESTEHVGEGIPAHIRHTSCVSSVKEEELRGAVLEFFFRLHFCDATYIPHANPPVLQHRKTSPTALTTQGTSPTPKTSEQTSRTPATAKETSLHHTMGRAMRVTTVSVNGPDKKMPQTITAHLTPSQPASPPPRFPFL